MGVEAQETRGIPRNRKCGNCRFYEPAPLWRKGWCRNPKLYPPHANHLVDANTIDCEGGFRSRIYWEAPASGQVAPPVQPDVRPVAPSNITPISPVAASSAAPFSSVAASNIGPISSKTPSSAILGGSVVQPIAPSTESFQRPLDQPTVSVYKHPLADRSFAPKSAGDSIRPVNTNPAPIISRQTYPEQSQETPSNNRPPLSSPVDNGGGEPPENNYQSFNSRSNRNFSAPEPSNREPLNRNYTSQEPANRSQPPPEPSKPFITPPPQGFGSSQAYGDNEDYGNSENYNEAAPGYQEQPTRPYQNPPPAQPQAWQEQEQATRKFNDTPPANIPPLSHNNNQQPNSNYSTQPGNYSSQIGEEKEPIRIQEALPVNTRSRPLEPKKQSQPTPARFRPVKEEQPAANMPVARDWKAILREKAPFTRNWNLEGITMNRQILPWAIGGVLGLILVVVIVANLGKKTEQPNPTVPVGATGTTSAAGITGGQTSGQITTGVGTKTSAAATTVASTTPPVVVKTALVKGTGAVLNVREEPTTKGKLVTTVKDGEKVTIKEGPKDADGRSWYQIEFTGKTGWAAAEFLEVQS